MHIAWLGKKSPFCGNVTYSREITNGLLDRGHQVSFLHFAAEENDADAWPGYQEVPLPFLYKSQVYTIPTLKATKILTQSLEELQPDVVHASLTLSPLDFLLPDICSELNIPLVSTFHTPYGGKRRNLKSSTQLLSYQLYAPFLAKYDRTIIFSEEQREILIKMGLLPESVAVIPNGVDAQKYCPGHSRIKAKYNAKHLFVYQGRIATEKNVESLLRGWKQAEMGADSYLLVVGDGPLRPSLEPFYSLDDGIIWLGAIADEQKRLEILRGADAFILPSLVEGLSLSLLEAMACGLACIATDAGADGEVLAGVGVVMDTQGVSGQLRTILPMFRDHPEMSQIMGQKSRDRVLQSYTLDGNINRLEQLYQNLLSQPRVSLRVG
jgi:glycosyltransferase involved in cell wall biosynthesis